MFGHGGGFLSNHIQSTGLPVMPGSYSPFFPHGMPVFSPTMGMPQTQFYMAQCTPTYEVHNPVVDSGVKAVVSGFQERGVDASRTSAALASAFESVSTPAPVRADGAPAKTDGDSKCPFLKEVYERAYAGPLRIMSPAQQQAFKTELARHVTPEAAQKCPFLAKMGILEELEAHKKAPHPMPNNF